MEEFKVNKIKHLAIIMDGNGRWAKQRAHERIWGHVRGSSIVSNVVEVAEGIGIKALTLYAFSTENWSRPETEVKTLFKLLKKFLQKEKNRILKNKIKFQVIGDTSKLPDCTKILIKDLTELTQNATGLKLTFAFGYGGRDEIVKAVKTLVDTNQEITEDNISNALYSPEIGDVDLLIRTGGDQRVSNFLLWQIAYAELFFTPTKWPDFTTDELVRILKQVECRERRFGAIEEMESLSTTKFIAHANHHQY